MLTLVAGASKSGKTTLPFLYNSKKPWNYAVYSANINKNLIVSRTHELKIAKSVRKELDIETNYNEKEYEKIKDEQICNPYTYRDLLENHSYYQRRRNPFYFIEKCYRKNLCGNETMNIMITDFRFPEEFKFLKGKGFDPVTVRIFRNVKEISTKKFPEYDSEHGLDDFLTDFLLLPINSCESDFKKAVSKYPQYSHFKQNSQTVYKY